MLVIAEHRKRVLFTTILVLFIDLYIYLFLFDRKKNLNIYNSLHNISILFIYIDILNFHECFPNTIIYETHHFLEDI